MPLNEEGFITRVSLRHSVSPDAVRTILRALRSGGGTMAQFSHSDFGGMSQWSPAVPEVSVTPLPVKAKRKIAKRAHPPGGQHIDRLQEQKRYRWVVVRVGVARIAPNCLRASFLGRATAKEDCAARLAYHKRYS
jgi:hypothetical protein